MAILHKRMKEIAFAPATAASMYANPAATTSHIKSIELHNTDGAATQDITLWNVPDSGGALGTEADANKTHKLTLPANATVELVKPGVNVLLEDTNDAIFAMAAVASKITIQIYGTQVT